LESAQTAGLGSLVAPNPTDLVAELEHPNVKLGLSALAIGHGNGSAWVTKR